MKSRPLPGRSHLTDLPWQGHLGCDRAWESHTQSGAKRGPIRTKTESNAKYAPSGTLYVVKMHHAMCRRPSAPAVRRNAPYQWDGGTRGVHVKSEICSRSPQRVRRCPPGVGKHAQTYSSTRSRACLCTCLKVRLCVHVCNALAWQRVTCASLVFGVWQHC